MPVLGRLIGLLLALQLVAIALISYTNATEFFTTGASMYAVCTILLARYVDKYAEWKDATGVYALILLCTGMGALISASISRTLYSVVVALSIVLVVIVYAVALMKAILR